VSSSIVLSAIVPACAVVGRGMRAARVASVSDAMDGDWPYDAWVRLPLVVAVAVYVGSVRARVRARTTERRCGDGRGRSARTARV
jgi:hypothetical protein